MEDAIKILSERAQKLRSSLATEEATKNALIMPFIKALGYDVFNPLEVVPEFVADVAGKKGEKVDYAIMKDGEPIIIIECKACGAQLDMEKCEQLHRYFLTLDSSIGVLTDGIRYLFYSRSDDGKKMDVRPFMDFNLDSVDKTLIPELRKLCKGRFDLKTTLETVSELRFNRHIKVLLEKNLNAPDDDFLRYFTRKAEFMATQKALERFRGYVKRAFSEFINEQVNARLKTALESVQKKEESAQALQQATEDAESDDKNDIITENEWHAFYLIKALLTGTVEPGRVFLRNTAGVGRSTVVLDDSRRKPLVRLAFDKPGKWSIGLIGENRENISHDINGVDEILSHANAIRAVTMTYIK